MTIVAVIAGLSVPVISSQIERSRAQEAVQHLDSVKDALRMYYSLNRTYEGAGEFLAVHEYEHLMRWAKQIDARPAVKRGRIVNKLSGDENEQLHERHDASDFELRTEDKIRGVAPDEAAAVNDDAI